MACNGCDEYQGEEREASPGDCNPTCKRPREVTHCSKRPQPPGVAFRSSQIHSRGKTSGKHNHTTSPRRSDWKFPFGSRSFHHHHSRHAHQWPDPNSNVFYSFLRPVTVASVYITDLLPLPGLWTRTRSKLNPRPSTRRMSRAPPQSEQHPRRCSPRKMTRPQSLKFRPELPHLPRSSVRKTWTHSVGCPLDVPRQTPMDRREDNDSFLSFSTGLSVLRCSLWDGMTDRLAHLSLG